MTSEVRAPRRADDARLPETRPTLVVTPETLGFRPHNCFACGQVNVGGLHLELHLEPERCWIETALPDRFEGWEGVIHGGILCTILDEVMAWSLIEHDSWGVTARLNVTFKRPVTVGQRIRAEGWVTDARRRLHRTSGRIVDAGTAEELASADAVYVAAPEERKNELKQRYGVRTLGSRPGREEGPQPPGREDGS